jgi:hypothetical protein
MRRQYKGVTLLDLLIGAGYGGHMLYRYMKTRADSAKRAGVIVHPMQNDDDVAEIGYIYSMRDEVFLRDENQVNLVGSSKCQQREAVFPTPTTAAFPISEPPMTCEFSDPRTSQRRDAVISSVFTGG